MADSTSALRLTPPAYQAYDTSPGEQMVLRGLDASNLGALYGVLMNQRAIGGSSQDRYSQQLGQVNAQQNVLARADLAQKLRESDQKAVLGLVQHGGMGIGPASSALDIRGLPQFLTQQQSAQANYNTDQSRIQNEQAQTFLRNMQGAQAGTEAGLRMPEGQSVPAGPMGPMQVSRVTGSPLDLDVQSLREAGASSRGSRDQFGATISPLTGETQYTARTNDPARTVSAAGQLRQAIELDQNGQTRVPSGGGEQGPARLGGAGPNATGRPQATTPRQPVREGPATRDEAAIISRIPRSQGTPQAIDRTPRGTFIIMDNGRRIPLPTE